MHQFCQTPPGWPQSTVPCSLVSGSGRGLPGRSEATWGARTRSANGPGLRLAGVLVERLRPLRIVLQLALHLLHLQLQLELDLKLLIL